MIETVFQKDAFQHRAEANTPELKILNAFQIYDGKNLTSPHHFGKVSGRVILKLPDKG